MASIWDDKLGVMIYVSRPIDRPNDVKGEAVCPNKGCNHPVNARGRKSEARVIKDVQEKLEKHLGKCKKRPY